MKGRRNVKRCEEMTLRLCSTSACMCLHTFAHMPCLKYIAVCCIPCKENCYGSDIVWVLLCEDATHDLREWNTVGHAKNYSRRQTHTHTLVAVRLRFAKFPLQYLACGLSDFISYCGLQCGPTVWRCSEHLRAIACSDTVSFSIAMAPLT